MRDVERTTGSKARSDSHDSNVSNVSGDSNDSGDSEGAAPAARTQASEGRLAEAIQRSRLELASIVGSLGDQVGRLSGERSLSADRVDIGARAGAVLLCGTSRLPATLAGTAASGLLIIEVAIDPAQSTVVDVSASGLAPLAERFVRALLVGQVLPGGLTKAISGIEQRYFADNRKALLAALFDVTKKYRNAFTEQAELTGSKTESEGPFTASDGDDIIRKMEALNVALGATGLAVNNMLGVILGLASVIRTEINADDPVSKDIEEIVSAARRGSSIITRSLERATRTDPRRESVRVASMVHDLVESMQEGIANEVLLTTDIEDGLTAIHGDPEAIRRALQALVTNAVQAVEGSGSVKVCVSRRTVGLQDVSGSPGLTAGEYVEMQVTDGGPGIDQEARQRAFEPLFTTKASAESPGLGLPMAYVTARSHGGLLTLASRPGLGTTATILLPMHVATEEAAPQEGRQLRPGGRTVLVVDDESGVRAMGRRLLKSLGYSVLLAETGEAALGLCAEHLADIDIVILDVAMPGMGGEECLEELLKLAPGLPVLISTGLPLASRRSQLLEAGASGVLSKPFDVKQLARSIGEALKSARAKGTS